jgi:N-glycosidase YbiA
MTLYKPSDIFNMALIEALAKSDKDKIVFERPMTMGFHYKSRRNLGSAIPEPKDELKNKPLAKKTNIHATNSIIFYDEYLPYYEFTNFYEGAPIKINDESFKTAEHYYQWQKFNDPITKLRIINAPTARIATDIADNSKYLIRNDFDKKNAMLTALREKFRQYQTLGKVLTSTDNKILIEHNMHDDYWSDGGDGSGLNMLGILLMQVREELNNGSLKYINPPK